MGSEADTIFMTRENIGELQVDAVVELSCIPASSKPEGFLIKEPVHRHI
jgi:hypothetical protein